MLNYCTKAKIVFGNLTSQTECIEQSLLSLWKSDSALNQSGIGPACYLVVVGYYHNTADKTTAIM